MFLIGMSAGINTSPASLCHPKDLHSLLISSRKVLQLLKLPFLTVFSFQIFNMFSNIVRTLRKSPAVLQNSRSLAGLPKFDEFSKIGMKQLWPAIAVLIGNPLNFHVIHTKKMFYLGIYGACFTVNPFATMSMEPNKWKKQ